MTQQYHCVLEKSSERSWPEKFAASLETARSHKPKDGNDTERLKVRIDSLKSQYQELQEDLATYETLKSRKAQSFVVHSLAELSSVLIKARVARGLTHKELAKKLGVSEKQVQRDEANDYRTAGLNRLIKIAKVLDVTLEIRVEVA
jgi:ribosome-binding protein aMBF1 (putative translation factor)